MMTKITIRGSVESEKSYIELLHTTLDGCSEVCISFYREGFDEPCDIYVYLKDIKEAIRALSIIGTPYETDTV